MKKVKNESKVSLIISSIGILVATFNLVFFPISSPSVLIAGIIAVQFFRSLHSFLKHRKKDDNDLGQTHLK